MNPQVLIVGAGPTGLVLAISLAKQHVPFRVIDQKDGPGQASRAMVVIPRTLEFYDQFGFVNDFLQDGIQVKELSIRVEGEEKASFHIGDLGEGISRFTSPVTYPQDEHEQFLLEKLQELGADVEWNTEFISYREKSAGIEATLRQNGEETVSSFAYICGCDGASSVTRHHMGVDFAGGTYDQEFYVMDFKGSGDPIGDHKLGMSMSKEEFSVFLPVRSSNTTRAIGVLPPHLKEKTDITSDQVVTYMEPAYGLKVNQVNWFSVYRVHHRVAEKFRVGRSFLVGDAAHVHSPVGGQGMNTGIGDAVNLGWKLAAVLQQRAEASLVDTYETERQKFAKVLVGTTDRAFKRIVSPSTVNKTLRKRVVPSLVPLLNHSLKAREKLFNLISQIRITYADSPLSSGDDKQTEAGVRLPHTGTNFAILRNLDWQVHIYGEVSTVLKDFSEQQHLLLQQFDYDHAAEQAGFVENAMYLVRPDGYLGLVHQTQDVQLLERYLQAWQIVPFRKGK